MKTRNIARLGAALLALCLCAAPALAAAPETGPWPGIEGEITKTLPFRDSTGDNTLVLTARETAGDDARSREIFAYLFRKDAGGAARRIWRVYDFEKDCEYHVDADFDESRVEITDLDKDGVSEIWLPYSLGCTSEVSPVEMKIIMYEGGQKHAMRGLSRDPLALNESRGGGTMDAAFRSGPAAFREHARKLWKSIDDDYIQPYLLAHPFADVRLDKEGWALHCTVNGKPASVSFAKEREELPEFHADFALADVTGDGVDELLVRVFIVGNTWVETLSDGHVYEAKGGELVEALSIPADGFGRWKPKSNWNLGICPGPDGTLAIDASAGKFDDDGEAGTFLLVRQGGDWTVKDAPKGFECSDAELAPAGASAEAMDDSDFVLLISRGGTVAEIRQALADGANPNAEVIVRGPGNETDTALCNAAMRDDPEVLRLLLAAGAKVNTVAWAGRTALMSAAGASGNAAAVRMLIEAGANLDIQDEDGETALMFAMRNESAEGARVLLAAGANPKLKDKEGHDALWHARHSRHKDDAEFIRLLEDALRSGAKKPAAQDAGAFSAADLKRMSTFVSNFVEVRPILPDFDMQKGVAPPNPALVYFGVLHNIINTSKSRSKSCEQEDCTHGSSVIEAKFVAESVRKYFDLEVQHRSVSGDEGAYSVHFDGKSYHFNVGAFDSGGDPVETHATVKRAVREGSIVRMMGDIYSVSNDEEKPYISATFVVTAKPHKWNGKDTWAILSLKREDQDH